jgi:hypothetical protein
MTGYLDPRYAASLSEFGEPLALARSGGALLVREIAGTGGMRDAMGTYPLLACKRWDQLASDFADTTGLVSVVAVVDPFGNWSMDDLRRAFPDQLVAFKRHWIVDLADRPLDRASRHHRYYARKAGRQLGVEVVADPSALLDSWCRLYDGLVLRHGFGGIKKFSRRAFAEQLQVSGLTMLRVYSGSTTIGLQLWYTNGEVAYSHLTAFDDDAYRLRASYLIYAFAIEHFSSRARWLDLGGAAGSDRASGDGLDAFKKGWATGQCDAWLGGRIFDAATYARLAGDQAMSSAYFPRYRAGELT